MFCTKCKKEQTDDCFYKDKTKKSGIHIVCKSCQKRNKQEFIIKNPDCLIKRRLISKQWRDKNPERSKYLITKATLLSKYGISLEDYNLLLEKQNNCCAVCKDIPTKQKLHVDHNHSTGKIRGLLCQACNVSIGKMKESPALLRALAEYIEVKL